MYSFLPFDLLTQRFDFLPQQWQRGDQIASPEQGAAWRNPQDKRP